MAYTADEIAALKRILITGAERVKHGDKETGFRSPQEIRQIIADAEAEIATANGSGPVRRSVVRFTSGL